MIRTGVHAALEAEADRLIRESLVGVTSQREKSDILTPWKYQDRVNREVLVESGTPDPSARRGMFHRAWNPTSPHLNSSEGVSRMSRSASLQRHVDLHGSGGFSFQDDADL